MKVLALASDPQASITQIRIARPFDDLTRQGAIQWRLQSYADLSRRELQWPDVLVMQRALGRSQLALMRRIRARGMPTVYEVDDLLTQPAEHLAQRATLLSAVPVLRAMLLEVCLVTVSTERLAQALAPDCEPTPIHVVPNVGRPEAALPIAAAPTPGPVTLVLASSDVQQYGALQSALMHLRHPGSPEILAIGPIGEAIDAALPGKVRRLPVMPHREFLETLGRLRNPVALMPLDASAFSRCKSAVKYFDYALCGVPAICVRRPPYADVVDDGRTGWLVDDEAQAWAAAIETAANDPLRRARVARAARDAVLAEHAPPRMAAAWLEALNRATVLRGRGHVRPSLPQRLGDALADGLSLPWRILRRANMARLARRRERAR